MSRNDDSIAAQMDEEEPYGSVAEGVFESRQQLRTPTAERLLAGAHNAHANQNHSSMSEGKSEGVASAGNTMMGREAYGSAERNMDRMGEFNPASNAADRVGSGDVHFAGTNHPDQSRRGFQNDQSTPMNEVVVGNSLMGGVEVGGEMSTGEREGGGGRSRSRRDTRRTSRERFGETSAMHESNLFYGDGEGDNDIEGTNTPAPAGFDSRDGGDVGLIENGNENGNGHDGHDGHDGDDGRNTNVVGQTGGRNERSDRVDADHNDTQRLAGYSSRQVPSEFAMVMGLSDGENDIMMEMERKVVSPVEPTDSNMGCIDINDALDDDKMIGSGSFKNRPSDADIIAWENQIKRNAQEASLSVLIGDKVSLDELVDEYARGSNEQWKANVSSLTKAYGAMRRSRGDGNCFFRAFLFSYLEHVVETGDWDERKRMIAELARVKTGLLQVGYEELVLEGPLEMLLDLLESVQTVDALEKQLRTEDISNYIVFLLRIIASGEVKDKATFFAPFIMGLNDMSVDEFCAKCIDPMGEESDHVVLVALTNALRVPMRVIYVDGREGHGYGNGGLDVKDFVPEGCDGDDIAVHLLFRPGHYDMLYRK